MCHLIIQLGQALCQGSLSLKVMHSISKYFVRFAHLQQPTEEALQSLDEAELSQGLHPKPGTINNFINTSPLMPAEMRIRDTSQLHQILETMYRE